MLRQLLVGGGVSVVNIAIHALVMTILVWVARAVSAKNKSHPAVFLMAIMISTVSVLMAAHAVEVIVWSLAYLIAHAVPAGGNLVYFAFRELHDTRLRRHCSSGTLASAWPDYRAERCVAHWVVDRGYL